MDATSTIEISGPTISPKVTHAIYDHNYTSILHWASAQRYHQ